MNATVTVVANKLVSPEWIKRAIYVLGMVPAAHAFYLGFTDQLGAEPVKALERLLGLYALRFLVIGLAITPLRKLTGVNLVRYRRAIGLVAFFNAALHLVVYLWLDQDLNWLAVWKDLVKRPYITIGMLSFSILMALAATSTNGMIKRLGAAAWQKLHKWVYLAVPAACVHFMLLVKVIPAELYFYLTVTALLLAYRAWEAFRPKPARVRG